LLDDLDKELNTYSMRLKEWFGWHFPEMTRVVTDNVQYAKTVLAVKAMRENINDLDA
jgi:nucleolar protein 58